jgi:hypothetical protein
MPMVRSSQSNRVRTSLAKRKPQPPTRDTRNLCTAHNQFNTFLTIAGVAGVLRRGAGMFETLQNKVLRLIAALIGDLSRIYQDFLHILEQSGLTIQNLVTLATLVFAIWKWWTSREAALLGRVEKILSKHSDRLTISRRTFTDAIMMPDIARRRIVPSFVEPYLSRFFRYYRMKPIMHVPPFNRSTHSQLSNARKRIETHVHAQELQLNWIKEQKITCLQLLGAQHAAAAEQAKSLPIQKLEIEKSVDYFKEAASVHPGHNGPQLLGLLAGQLVRLEKFSEAERVLGAWLNRNNDAQTANDNEALACATLLRINAHAQHGRMPNGTRALQSMTRAVNLVSGRQYSTARELLEIAQIHNSRAIIREAQGHPQAAMQSFDDARSAYARTIERITLTRPNLWQQTVRFLTYPWTFGFTTDRSQELRKLAKNGMEHSSAKAAELTATQAQDGQSQSISPPPSTPLPSHTP